ncbi:uncharacterized protein B0P05DRAFT_573069 [Gilbertella persicaria]|uniref:uncharacterized protein n=1 Tax=Gilbertella persicaria TaxID=101096 RepID=UPI00221E57ED|nr:uncharacterized protein B0P05DRAFT_573069 [Gilbertella persicaria]KAI8072135.1 hypothetical protein B0P05DRAFT_573069 [Gilbertella persicaria]
MASLSEVTLNHSLQKEKQAYIYIHHDKACHYTNTLSITKEDSLVESIPSLYESDKKEEEEEEEDTEDEEYNEPYKGNISYLIQPYSPQLNFNLDASEATTATTRSRFKSAFQRLRGIAMHSSNMNNIAPSNPKSCQISLSLADKIKSKLKSKEHPFMPRSSSLSSITCRLKKKCADIPKSFSSHHLSFPLRSINNKTQGDKRAVQFAKSVTTTETYSKLEYDRESDPDAVCTRLTPILAQQIKEELNAFKLFEMEVHESSKIHTHFFF